MADAFIIEISGITAGIVASYRDHFRFHASHSALRSLEGRMFKSPGAAQSAAERTAAKTLGKAGDQPTVFCRRLY